VAEEGSSTAPAAAPADSAPTTAVQATISESVAQSQIAAAGGAAAPSSLQQAAASPPSAAKPAAAIDQGEVVRQVASAMKDVSMPAAGDTQQITVQLHPQEWGQLQVTVTTAPSSTAANAPLSVTAHVIADNPAAKAALENRTVDLRDALKESGYKLDQITVSVQSASGAQAGGQFPREGSGGSPEQYSGQTNHQGTPSGESQTTGFGGQGSSGQSFAASAGEWTDRRFGGGQADPTAPAGTLDDDSEGVVPAAVPAGYTLIDLHA